MPDKYLEDKPLPGVPLNAKKQSETAAYMTDLYKYAVSCKEDKRSIKLILKEKE